jgi:hypothetical protein
MTPVWQWIAGIEAGLVIALIGYIFKSIPKLRADLAGMTTSYEREKERVSDMVAVERDAKQAAAIGLAVAQALGKLPAEETT